MSLSDKEKELIIKSSLNNSISGGTKLASSLANPIRQALNYQAIGRKLLMIDGLENRLNDIYYPENGNIAIGRREFLPNEKEHKRI